MVHPRIQGGYRPPCARMACSENRSLKITDSTATVGRIVTVGHVTMPQKWHTQLVCGTPGVVHPRMRGGCRSFSGSEGFGPGVVHPGMRGGCREVINDLAKAFGVVHQGMRGGCRRSARPFHSLSSREYRVATGWTTNFTGSCDYSARAKARRLSRRHSVSFLLTRGGGVGISHN